MQEIRIEEATCSLPKDVWAAMKVEDWEATASRCLVAREGERVVGALFFAPFGSVHIAGVGVVEDRRRRGIGSALYRGAAERMGVSLYSIYPGSYLSSGARALRAKLGMPLAPKPPPGPPILLLNTTIVTGLPTGTDSDDCLPPAALYTVRRLSPAGARAMVEGRKFDSAIGHEAAARCMSALLGVEVPVSRAAYEQMPGQRAIALKLRGRLPEGKVLVSTEELDAIGYDLFELYRHPNG